ncbi:MAG: penicillin-insensitive murein endopeptidase [Myxococcota bacterium]
MRGVLGLVAALVVLSTGSFAHARTKRELPKKFTKSPYSLMSLTVGAPNRGYQIRPIRLKERKYLKIKANSRRRNYGHPALVKMLYRTARDIARSVRGSVMLVGDLSDRDGGKLPGHRSHQSGRDADIAFYAKDRKGRSVRLNRFVAFDGDGKAKDKSGLVFDDRRNWLLVQAWLRDHRAGISFIFVSRPLRKRLLAFAQAQRGYRKYAKAAAALMREPARAEAHDDHFHVRISCPKKLKEICIEHPR